MRTAACTVMLALALAANAAASAPLRDPFARPTMPVAGPAPGTEETVVPPPPTLRAIMYDPGHSMANIGGQILMAGEWYGDYRIARIDERSVTLLRKNVKTVLVLDKEGSK